MKIAPNILLASAVWFLSFFPVAGAAQDSEIIDLVGTTGFVGLTRQLDAGRYMIEKVGPPDGAYTALNPNAVDGTGDWQWRVFWVGLGLGLEAESAEIITVEADRLLIRAEDTDDNYFATAEGALAAAPTEQIFVLGTGGEVTFYLGDDQPGDNTGGVSFRLTTLPGETTNPTVSVPAVPPMGLLVLGAILGLVGFRRLKS